MLEKKSSKITILQGDAPQHNNQHVTIAEPFQHLLVLSREKRT
jgi:hypothetical protein